MNQVMSERYKKVLVTVGMGFRTEEDVKNNGLYRFTKQQKKELIEFVNKLFNKNRSVVALKIKQIGYRSIHININSEGELNKFINNLDNIFGKDNEIWFTSSSVLECWRCRIYLSNDNNDLIEMAYSYDDHILDHINSNLKTPYICYKKKKNNFEILNTNLNDRIEETSLIVKDIFKKYSSVIKKVKEDIDYIGINGISLDVRVNNGYDFHDFDVDYCYVERVVDYYFSILNNKKTN